MTEPLDLDALEKEARAYTAGWRGQRPWLLGCLCVGWLGALGMISGFLAQFSGACPDTPACAIMAGVGLALFAVAVLGASAIVLIDIITDPNSR